MKNAKAFVLVGLVCLAGFALTKICYQGSCEVIDSVESTHVNAPELVAEVVQTSADQGVDIQAAVDVSNLTDDKSMTEAFQSVPDSADKE
jgi:hypothetical protein